MQYRALSQVIPREMGSRTEGDHRRGSHRNRGDQQHELRQGDNEVEGAGKIAPNHVPGQIPQGEGEVAVAYEVDIVDGYRQQIGQEKCPSTAWPSTAPAGEGGRWRCSG